MIIYRRKHKKPVTSSVRKKYSKEMKKKPTLAEKVFCKSLDDWGKAEYIFQCVVGFYIPDFLFPSKMLIIELDGSVHYGREEYDKERDFFLKAFGFTILRISNIQSSFYKLDKILEYPDKDGFHKAMGKLRQMMQMDDEIKRSEERKYQKNLKKVWQGRKSAKYKKKLRKK